MNQTPIQQISTAARRKMNPYELRNQLEAVSRKLDFNPYVYEEAQEFCQDHDLPVDGLGPVLQDPPQQPHGSVAKAIRELHESMFSQNNGNVGASNGKSQSSTERTRGEDDLIAVDDEGQGGELVNKVGLGLNPVSLKAEDIGGVISHQHQVLNEVAGIWELAVDGQIGASEAFAGYVTSEVLSTLLFLQSVALIGSRAEEKENAFQVEAAVREWAHKMGQSVSVATGKKRRRIFIKFRDAGVNPMQEFYMLRPAHFYKNLHLEPDEYVAWLVKARENDWDAETLKAKQYEEERARNEKERKSDTGVDAAVEEQDAHEDSDHEGAATFTHDRSYAAFARKVEEHRDRIRTLLEQDNGSAKQIGLVRRELEPLEEALFELDKVLVAEQKGREQRERVANREAVEVQA